MSIACHRQHCFSVSNPPIGKQCPTFYYPASLRTINHVTYWSLNSDYKADVPLGCYAMVNDEHATSHVHLCASILYVLCIYHIFFLVDVCSMWIESLFPTSKNLVDTVLKRRRLRVQMCSKWPTSSLEEDCLSHLLNDLRASCTWSMAAIVYSLLQWLTVVLIKFFISVEVCFFQILSSSRGRIRLDLTVALGKMWRRSRDETVQDWFGNPRLQRQLVVLHGARPWTDAPVAPS